MLLHLSDLSPEPLHQQISRQIREKILAGDLVEGTLLPSIRALAREIRVSVITVQRAYEDLDREGLLVAKRGKGFFIAGHSEDGKSEIARNRLRDALHPILSEAAASGLESNEILNIVRDTLQEKE